MEFQLTEEQRLIQQTARDLANNELAPRAQHHDLPMFDNELPGAQGTELIRHARRLPQQLDPGPGGGR